MTGSSEHVRWSTGADGVGRLVLDRPGAMNAITTQLASELARGLTDLAGEARAILITGAGRHFCVGGDFKALQAIQPDRERLRALFTTFHGACSLIAELPVPVVCAVHGYAMAGGFELMQACDVALVATDATLADNHANYGQIPGGGGSQRLPRLVGCQRALGLILSGERLSGEQAVAWGLAYRAFPAADLEREAIAFTAALATKDPTALAQIKRLVRDGAALALTDALALEVDAVVEHITAADLSAFDSRRS